MLQGRAEGASHYVVVGRGRWLSEVLDGLDYRLSEGALYAWVQ